ncbi:RepB family plasmid replication initiator protein [Xenorhabdus bovienii]|uniref:RepB family plasmid replication initiator protein n=1 Tax=Xenorhabdus bovienii TaxID=40576 RepID=UPI00237CA0E2|nr:RepB family plasmid replication initiator protein [Xenorhabdus bovienii]MDE1497276.1 RepB family plasmid replication initiator protein [Xenorhabdus bovienii]MDE9494576.1 RepB family plasmid replication initiator protein [Xenorhabdus bovienii]MDE9502973.1 RepB family plasmid replication initiator protein [Xenorhabdus bovienii]MDE9526608.1 RepB family plasmid replication initiator protein [Xenorhabdus bovienii]
MNNNIFFSEALNSEDENNNNKLTVTRRATVQPVVLMRLNVFVPTCRPAKGVQTTIDATSVLKNLEFSRREGYNNVKITGERLNMTTDYRIWAGIIEAFSKYGLQSNFITLSFHEFASMCRFESKRFDKRLRQSMAESLTRIRGKTITFTKLGKDGIERVTATGLLKTGDFNFKSDCVELEADQRLWELYQADYRVLLRHKPINALTRKEVAQVLYIYIESLPPNPAPISFERFRKRLALLSPIKEQNRTIKQSLQQLEDIGYLTHSVVSRGRETTVIIHSRAAKLKEFPFG